MAESIKSLMKKQKKQQKISLRQKIAEKGYTEEYQNGANQKGVKKSAEVEIYNTMIKNYMAVIKQLTDLVPKEQVATKTNDGFEDFVNGRDD